jgi:DNA-binding XRE family transcriptional regulator
MVAEPIRISQIRTCANCRRSFVPIGFVSVAPNETCSFSCADALHRRGAVAETFPERLKRLRTTRRMTQATLGGRIGACDKSVSLWELGKRAPGADTLALMARTFGVTMDYLWWGKGTRQRVTRDGAGRGREAV